MDIIPNIKTLMGLSTHEAQQAVNAFLAENIAMIYQMERNHDQ